jgi:hypothetical protein
MPIVPQRCCVRSIATWHEIWTESRSYENISLTRKVNYFALEKETHSSGPEQKWRDTLRSDGRFKYVRISQFFVTSWIWYSFTACWSLNDSARLRAGRQKKRYLIPGRGRDSSAQTGPGPQWVLFPLWEKAGSWSWSTLFSTEVKHAWNYNSTGLYVIRAWYLSKDRGTFTFIFKNIMFTNVRSSIDRKLHNSWTEFFIKIMKKMAGPQLRRLVAGFQPGSGHVGFVVDKTALG